MVIPAAIAKVVVKPWRRIELISVEVCAEATIGGPYPYPCGQFFRRGIEPSNYLLQGLGVGNKIE